MARTALVGQRAAFRYRLDRVGAVRRFFWGVLARWHGKRDGRLGEPRDDYPVGIGERDVLKQRGDATLRSVKIAWQSFDAVCHSYVVGLLRRREALIESADIRDARRREAQAVVEDREAELEKRRTAERQRGEADRWHIPLYAYWLALPAIFAGEIFINGFAFEVLGAVPTELKYAIAGAISLAVVICSHAVGILLKSQENTSQERAVLRSALFFPIFLLVGLSLLRIFAFKQLSIGTDIGLSLDGATAAADTGEQTKAIVESIVFAVINIVMFIAACILSFFAHDAHSDAVRKASWEARGARFTRWQATRRWQRARTRVARVEREVVSMVAVARGAYGRASTESRRHKDYFEEVIAKYTTANLRARARKERKTMKRMRNALLIAARKSGTEVTTEPAAFIASSQALLQRPEVFDEMTKEAEPAWQTKLWRAFGAPEPTVEHSAPRKRRPPVRPGAGSNGRSNGVVTKDSIAESTIKAGAETG